MIDNDDMSIILPGRIVTYYPSDQTADISISAEKVFSDTKEKLQITKRQILVDVPVHTPYGGGWSITFPIKTGDTCLICFSQVGYDHWFYQDKDTGGVVAKQPVPHLRRQFSEDDGFAIVGFNTKPRAIQSYSGVHSQWRNETAEQIITLNEDGTIRATSTIKITIDAPETRITGDLIVDGDIQTTGINGDGLMSAVGTISTIGDVVSDTTGKNVSLTNHVHTGDSGGTTSSPL